MIETLKDRLVDLALERAEMSVIVNEVGETLRGSGLPLDHIRLTSRTLHPAIDAIGVSWHPGGVATGDVFGHQQQRSEAWQRSPLHHMISTRKMRMRRRIADPGIADEYPVFMELRDEGVTDYLAHLLVFGSSGPGNKDGLIVRWMSKKEGGFSEEDIAALDSVARAVGAAVLPGVQRQIARNLLDAYVGARSGARVLDGAIQPGDDVEIEAVILIADLAGFTAASDRLPGEQLTVLLDRHLDAMLPPIDRYGGEVLAFLGDGVLAAFEIDGDANARSTAAIDAAVEAVAAVSALAEQDGDALPLDIALHLGSVRYGNVGAAGRQAFTVIGPAVNIASRIEALCGDLGYRILASEAVARASGDGRLTDIGAHSLRGVVEPVRLFALGSELKS
jgi:adenylate cyclase